jgi:hypothetical protein
VRVVSGNNWEIRCDVCKSHMEFAPAANPQPRMPSGWLDHGKDKHTCALCSRLTVNRLSSTP